MSLLPLLLALAGTAAAADPTVSAKIVTEPSAAVPRKAGWIAVVYQAPPGWRIMRDNPGIGGAATTVTLTLPEGWTASPPQWPGADSFPLDKGLLGYGWEGQAALLTEVTPPSTARPGSQVQIPWRTSWTVCKDVCALGSAEGLLTLDVKPAVEARSTGALDPFLRRLPRSPDALALTWRSGWTAGAKVPTWTLHVNAPADLFTPLASFEAQGLNAAVAPEGDGATLTVTGKRPDICKVAQGELRLSEPSGPRYVLVEVPCP